MRSLVGCQAGTGRLWLVVVSALVASFQASYGPSNNPRSETAGKGRQQSGPQGRAGRNRDGCVGESAAPELSVALLSLSQTPIQRCELG
jgi:hypothetical protein